MPIEIVWRPSEDICSRILTLLAAQLVSSAWRLGGPEVEGRTRRTRRGGRGCQPPTTCTSCTCNWPQRRIEKGRNSIRKGGERERWRCQWSRHPGPACQLIKTTPTDQLELWSCPPLTCHGLALRPTRLEITAIAGVVELRLGWERLKTGLESCFCFLTI